MAYFNQYFGYNEEEVSYSDERKARNKNRVERGFGAVKDNIADQMDDLKDKIVSLRIALCNGDTSVITEIIEKQVLMQDLAKAKELTEDEQMTCLGE